MQMTPPLWQKVKPLDESERGEWKSWLKAQHSENEDHGIGPIILWQLDGETIEIVTDFIFLGSKITADFDCVDHNCGKLLKRWEYQTTWPASWEICMQVRKQLLDQDMEQQTGSK